MPAGNTLSDEIRGFLAEVGEPMKAKDLLEHITSIANTSEASVRSALSHMKQRGQLEKPKYGYYALPSGNSDGAREQAPAYDTKTPAPPEGEAGEEGEAVVFGVANAADDLVLEASAEPPRTRIVTRAKWRADFGESVPYLHRDYGYWVVRGDSAAPVYFRGEEVPVHKLGETQEFESERVYIFRWHDDPFLKRLFRTPGGIYAQSLNPAIRDMQFRPNNGHDFAVLAEVQGSMKQQFFNSLLGAKLNPNRELPPSF